MKRRLVLIALTLTCVAVVALTAAAIALGSWSIAMGGAGAVLVAALILAKRPGNGVGRALLAFGIATVLSDVTTGAMEVVSATGTVSLDRLLVTIGASVFVLVGTTGFSLLLVYPTGRARGRWRWVHSAVWAVGAIGVVSGVIWSATLPAAEVARVMVASIDSTNPAGYASGVTVMFGLPLALVSLATRYRAAGVIERLQIKWLILAAGLLLATILIQNLTGDFDSPLSKWSTMLAFALFPVAIGVAILRYRLYDIDRLISRTVSYAVVAAVLVAIYLGGVLALGSLVGQGNPLAVAGATLTAAGVFNPVRRRVQAFIERRFDRSRYDSALVVDEFGSRLRKGGDLEGLITDLSNVVGQTLRPATMSMWLREEPS
jgi:MFS family permease